MARDVNLVLGSVYDRCTRTRYNVNQRQPETKASVMSRECSVT